VKYLLVIALILTGCSANNVTDIKAHAEETFRQAGYEVVGYEGYQYGSFGTWGGCVWYTIKKLPDNGVNYHACISKWGDEYHLYNLRAIDAIKP
jgi:hypothetical protein